MTLGAKAPHSKGDLSPMTEKTQKSKVVVLVKHMHTHTHPHTRLLDFSGYPPLFGGLTVSTYISAVTLVTAQPGPTHASAAGFELRTRVFENSYRNHFSKTTFQKLVPEPLFENHFLKTTFENSYYDHFSKTQKRI